MPQPPTTLPNTTTNHIHKTLLATNKTNTYTNQNTYTTEHKTTYQHKKRIYMDENARYSGYNLSISNSQYSSQKKEELSSKLHCSKKQNIFHKKDINAAITDNTSLYQNNKRINADEHALDLEYIIFISNKNKILSGAVC
jgi:hypothetical protein